MSTGHLRKPASLCAVAEQMLTGLEPEDTGGIALDEVKLLVWAQLPPLPGLCN